jgi:hypothetical protein
VKHRKPRSRRTVWRWPIVFAVLTAAGLVSALVGDGPWDVASWFALGIPVIVCAWFGLAKSATGRTR